MNDTKLRQLVTEAIALDRSIAVAEARLKEIKKLVTEEARSREDEATATPGGGTSNVIEGTGGDICRVTFTARALKGEIPSEGEIITKVRALVGDVFPKLFTPVLGYKLVDDFRTEARSLVPATANKLIKLCENAGKASVSFETKEAA